jgi:hypothetical protein
MKNWNIIINEVLINRISSLMKKQKKKQEDFNLLKISKLIKEIKAFQLKIIKTVTQKKKITNL